MPGDHVLEITYIQNKPSVYRSAGFYDRVTRSPKEVSICPGLLHARSRAHPQRDTRYAPRLLPGSSGYENAAVLTVEFRDLLPPLQDAFRAPWREPVALLFTRLLHLSRSGGRRSGGRGFPISPPVSGDGLR